jgi:hypothetical protein
MYRDYILIIIILFLTTGSAWSQTSVTAQAFAEIIEALTANESDQLNFGRFSPESGGGNIVISPDGARSSQGAVVLAPGVHSPGRFSVSGAPGASFALQLPEGQAVLLHQGSGQTMVVGGWVSDPPAGSGQATLADGSRVISIGATLSVGPIDQNPAGLYSGTYQLTFAYN